jgi:probable F420-dependent oxidoreductase
LKKIRFGVHLPNSGGTAVYPDSLVDYEIIREIAREAEKLGFNSIWVNEHVTPPTEQSSIETKFFEPLTLLGSLASETRRIILGTAIVILPFRDPFILAKEVSTLSAISGNRFVLGVGPGRFEREYSAQSKNWPERNRILEEEIRLIRELLSGRPVDFSGRYYSSKDFSIRPIPGKLPIVLGGSGDLAIRRAARLCDGIMPGHTTIEHAKEMKTKLNQELEKIGFSEKEFAFYNEIILSIDTDHAKAKSKFHDNAYVRKIPYATDLASKALIGTPEEIRNKIQEYTSAGVEEFVLIFTDESKPEFARSMGLFSSNVMDEVD